MGVIVNKNKRAYKPKKENEIKLNSYLKKRNVEHNKLGTNLLQ